MMQRYEKKLEYPNILTFFYKKLIFIVYNVINKINMSRIDNIITEAIDNFVNESILSEGTLDDIKSLLKAFKGKSNLSQDDLRKERKLKKKADSITDTVDQENTDIAAVARNIFPDHTEEGAQSQLRKILNHERPMTKDVASKIERMISRGRIAVK